MKMFANHHVSYAPNEETHGGSFSSYPSTSSSFSSDSSSSSWESEMVMMTPASTPRRGSPSMVKLEGTSVQNPSPTSSPNRYEAQAAFCPITSIPQDMMTVFNDPNLLFQPDSNMLSEQVMVDYSSFHSYNNLNAGLSGGMDNHLVCDTFQASQTMSLEPPALVLDLFSPESGMSSSPVFEDFVVPSETTFLNAFDMHSPMAPVKSLHFDISYETEFDPHFAIDEASDAGSMSYYMPTHQPSHHEPASSSPAPTPSRTSLRQSLYRPPPSAAALQRVQEIKAEDFPPRSHFRDTKRDELYRDLRRDGAPSSASAARLRRVKRESKDSILDGSIRLERKAKRVCLFEGCNGKFQRQEHLKRHERTHLQNAEVFKCEFCPKTFGRSDNLKSHVYLHTLPDGTKKSRRTAYNPKASAKWHEMDRKRGKSAVMRDGDFKDEQGGKILRARVAGY
ncbi:uncharacterized protein LY89DRAFT_767595 [Mollisia scopiformis]|uniref:C2H2-type domain-containing protein n=1 Tax=Mollisia scopiformis TaxID=149040 RepID=A0A194XN82_MOLSC|nr:uncharacterized protein LY89DRAFT_767595 [Mollisia scopiformis]KUJ21554.1 hypothetical protein LY89DRAFT_767595 [Mollisia scopiformis]